MTNTISKKPLSVRLILISLFLLLTTPVFGNEVVRLYQVNRQISQVEEDIGSKDYQGATEALQRARNTLGSTLIIKSLKKAEMEGIENEIEETKKLADKKVEGITVDTSPTSIPTATASPTSIPKRLSLSPTSIPTNPSEANNSEDIANIAEEVKKEEKSTSPTPTKKDSPPPQELYNYDSYYPIILSFSDDNGQVKKSSAFNKYPYSELPNVLLEIGDIVHCKVQASDPKNRQILYHFFSNSRSFNEQISRDENGKQKFTLNNEIQYTVTERDLESVGGQRFEIHAAIKSDKEYLRIPSQGYDDTIELHYNILMPEN